MMIIWSVPIIKGTLMYIHLGGWGGGGGSMHLWTQRVIAVQTLECKQKYGEIMNFDERIERALGEIPLPACSHSWPILTLKDSEKSFLQSHLWQLDMCFFPSLIFDTDKIIKMDYLELDARGQNKMSNPLMKTKHMGCVWCKRQRERERERKRKKGWLSISSEDSCNLPQRFMVFNP